MTATPIAPDALAEAVMSGAELGLHLSPDERFPQRQRTPEYIEALDLPYAVAVGETVFAMIERDHMPHVFGAEILPPHTYAYTNCADIFANFSCGSETEALQTGQMVCLVMSSRYYKTLQWYRRHGMQRVWTSLRPDDLENVVASIREGRRHRAVFADEAGVVRSVPVTLPYYWVADGSLEVATHARAYPALFDSPESVEELLNRVGETIRGDPSARPGPGAQLRVAVSCTFHELFSDGTYYTAWDIPAGRKRSYAWFELYAEA